jgi:hypothetical protein
MISKDDACSTSTPPLQPWIPRPVYRSVESTWAYRKVIGRYSCAWDHPEKTRSVPGPATSTLFGSVLAGNVTAVVELPARTW